MMKCFLLASAGAYTLSAGRIGAIAAALIGLTGAIVGALAFARSRDVRRRRAIIALVLAPIGAVIGALVVATADGGIGTGNGLGGGIVAMMVSLIGIALGTLALRRTRT